MAHENIMVDLETLDTDATNKAVVVSVGLVRFNPFDEDTWETIKHDEDRTLYEVLPITPQIVSGRTVGGGALLWWMEQMLTGHPNIKKIFSRAEQGDRDDIYAQDGDLHTKLHEIMEFLDSGDRENPYYLWAKPAHFDCPKIETLLTENGFDMPVPWFNYRCMSGARTACKLVNISRPRFKTEGNQDHHALWDAIEQTLELQGWLRNLRHGSRS